METDHDHEFAPGEWPFDCPTNTPAFSSQRVVRDGHPILAAFHDHDGDWQFLHGEILPEDEVAVTCLACAFENDRTIGLLADLPIGWMASRSDVSEMWEFEKFNPADERI